MVYKILLQAAILFPKYFLVQDYAYEIFHIVSYSSFSLKFDPSRRRNYEMGGLLYRTINYLNTDNNLTNNPSANVRSRSKSYLGSAIDNNLLLF